MAFNLEELKSTKENQDNHYIIKLRSYLDSDKFEDSFQEYLQNEIRNGQNRGILIFEISKTDRSEVFLSILTYDISINYEFCHDSQDKIGDLNKYVEVIEDKLDELKLDYRSEYTDNLDFANIAEHYTKECKFMINLNFDN